MLNLTNAKSRQAFDSLWKKQTVRLPGHRRNTSPASSRPQEQSVVHAQKRRVDKHIVN